MGPTIDISFSFGGGYYRSYQQHLAGGPPSTSASTSVVAATGAIGSNSEGPRHRRLLQLRWCLVPELSSTPLKGPVIDVFFNFGGGCCRSYRHHPQGASHRRLVKLGTCCQYFLVTPTRGHYDKHYCYKQGKFHEKRKTSFEKKIFLGPCGAKNLGNIILKKFLSTKYLQRRPWRPSQTLR
jgi:hypothetical protein